LEVGGWRLEVGAVDASQLLEVEMPERSGNNSIIKCFCTSCVG